MAGINLSGGGKGGRKSVDSEINMVPMIDLLMVTVSFLLITAVWTHTGRLNANAEVPGSIALEPPDTNSSVKTMHVETGDPAKFTVLWKQGAVVLRS